MNYYNEGFKQEMKSEQKYETKEIAMSGMSGKCCEAPMMMPSPCSCTPIYECPQERVCHRYICYDVPHIMPCNTRIINHHVYRHTYTPCYTTCEENVVSNVYDRNCCF